MDIVNSSDILCANNIPCMTKWNKLSNMSNMQQVNSLTHLGRLSGAPDNSYIGDTHESDSNYGAEFKYVNLNTSSYQPIIIQKVSPGWLAEKEEQTFLNNLKVKNEPPVKTYADLQLSPIPDQIYETYEPVIYNKEKGDNYYQINQCQSNNKEKTYESFKSSNTLDIRSDIDTDVGVGFIWKIIFLIVVFFIIYYLLKKK